MKIQLERPEHPEGIFIAWPLDPEAARWLREINLGTTQHHGDVLWLRLDWVCDFMELADGHGIEVEHVAPSKRAH